MGFGPEAPLAAAHLASLDIQRTGRRNLNGAAVPTDVEAEAVVAGYGPPSCCEYVTLTPVGHSFQSIRPTRPVSSTTRSAAIDSSGSPWIDAVNSPSKDSARARSSFPSSYQTKSTAGPKHSTPISCRSSRNRAPVVRSTVAPSASSEAEATCTSTSTPALSLTRLRDCWKEDAIPSCCSGAGDPSAARRAVSAGISLPRGTNTIPGLVQSCRPLK